jgi:predicted aspartyl protease
VGLGIRSFFAALIALSLPIAAKAGCERDLDVPVMMTDGLPLVRVSVKNKEAVLILDTGAESTVLSTPAVDRLELPRNMVYPRRMRGLGGGVVGGTVELPDLTINRVRVPNVGALVGGIDLPRVGAIVPDGLLGADILSDFDLDLDYPHGLVRLSCHAGAPSWTPPYAPIEANRSLHRRLFFRVILDDKSLAAIIDTGAQHSVVDNRAALAAAMDPQALSREPAKTVRGITSGAGSQARSYRFRELVIGQQRISTPTLLVTTLGLQDADLILGIDFLRTHRVWLSYSSHQVVIGSP